MTAALTDEQLGLRDAVRGMLAKRSGSAAVRAAMVSGRGYDAELWRVLCDQIGVAALGVPEQFGGAGAGPVEVHVVMDELGRTLTPSPMLGSAVLAARLLLAHDDVAACARLLPLIASGGIVSVACADARGWGSPGVVLRDGRLYGSANYVLDGDLADVLLVATSDGVVEVDPATADVTRTHTPTMDPTRRLARVDFSGAVGTRLAGDAAAALGTALDAACVALAAEQAGAAARALQLTVDYAKVRVQFGRPIGSFQALKHRMADLHVLVEGARATALAAAEGLVAASVAKAQCSEAFATVAGEAIQLHGGIAITWEHDAHLYFKRAHADAQLFGSPDEHVGRVASRLVDVPNEVS